MRPSSRWTYMAGIGVGIALIAAACSSAATATTSVLGATSAPTTAGASTFMVGTNSSPTLGAYLTGQNGMTLYVRTTDTPDATTCTGTCATDWPPLTVAGGAMVSGPTAATDAFGTMTRPDGTKQVTYNHMPLYYFAGDSAAGDTNGEGKLGIWFVAPVSGAVMSAAPASTTAPASPTSGGYGGY